jgi:hypothetical protein
MDPIWKDYYYSLGYDAAGKPFAIYDVTGSRYLLTGRAFSKNAGSAKIRINNVAAPCFQRHFYPAELEVDKPTLRIAVEDGNENVLTQVTFYPDWSYDANRAQTFNPATDWLNEPIGNVVAFNQYLPVTNYYSSYRTFTVVASTTSTQYAQGNATTIIDLSNILAFGPALKYVQIGSDIYPAVCARWVLYYINAFGGWDWMVVRGNVIEGDELDVFAKTKDGKLLFFGKKKNGLDVFKAVIITK